MFCLSLLYAATTTQSADSQRQAQLLDQGRWGEEWKCSLCTAEVLPGRAVVCPASTEQQSRQLATATARGGGRKKRRNVVVVTWLVDYWRRDLCFVGYVRLSYSSKSSQTVNGKSFVFFIKQLRCSSKNNIQLFISTKIAFRRSLTYDDHPLQSNPELIAQNYPWGTRTTSNEQRWTEMN